MKILSFFLAVLCLVICPSKLLAENFTTIDSTKGAKINVYMHQSKTSAVKEKPILLVHGFNSGGKVWDSYVERLMQNGYDVIIVDMRGNKVDVDGDHKVDTPVVGDSWGYGVRDLGDDVGMALIYSVDYLNKNLPDRNYKKVDVVTHSTGALAVTSYSHSMGLVPYRNNIDTIIELAPPNNGSTSLVANIKEVARITPSVFTQSIIAYEYALELLHNKVWVPGGDRMESEKLRKELTPESLFLKSVEGLGPDRRIKTFIAIGDEDFVVGDWSPAIDERDDIGYEYFVGLDHFNFCNSELVITALLDKLENDAESNFFKRYKPYRNKTTIAFLSGPGIDHPDDTFDVTTFAKGIDISPRELFNLYLRIAGKKDKENILKYWEGLVLFEKAQKEIENGAAEQDIIDEWQDLLAEKNEFLNNCYINASKEYLECPDLAILVNGYFFELTKLIIEKVKEPVRLIDHTFNPSILNEQKILIIPSGGLSGLSQSTIFRKKLSEFVENGGILICFSQQHGYDFNALPTAKLRGYGWEEDASCHSRAAYIENFHQILSSQSELYPDIKLDGYFTDYPDDTTILLRRTKNLYPAMLMYEFGKGLVIAANIYSDWGYSNGQTSLAEIALVRDLIRWAKTGKNLPEYKKGKVFKEVIKTLKDFSNIEMILRSAEGAVLEKKMSDNSLYELGTVLSKPGIYCVDYILYNSDSEIVQPLTEGFYFCFAEPPEGSIENPGFTFNITTDAENYARDTETTFTFHIKNNTNHDETIKCKARLSHHEINFKKTIDIPANSTISFSKIITADKTDLLAAEFYSSANNLLGRAERGINVFEPSIEINIDTDKKEYLPGQNILIRSTILNALEIELEVMLVFNIIDSENREICYKTKALRLRGGEVESWAQDFEIPQHTARGIYKIKLNAFLNLTLVGSASTDIDIPSSLLYTEDKLPANFFELLTIALEKSLYSPGEFIPAKVIINNKGTKIEDALLDIRVLRNVNIGYLSGVVMDEKGLPVKGVKVGDAYTSEEGKFLIEDLIEGKHVLGIRARGYDEVSKEVKILAGPNNMDFNLNPVKYGDFSGLLEDSIGSVLTLTPIDVSASGVLIRTACVSTDGNFQFKRVPIGIYRLTIQPEGASEVIEIKERNIVLDELEGYSTPVLKQVLEAEPNDDFDNAESIGVREEVICTMHVDGDNDYFAFNIKEKGIFYIKMKEVPDGLRPSLKIYNAKAKIIAQKAGFSGQKIVLEAEIGESGKYYLMVKDWYSNFSSLNPYSFETYFINTVDEYEPSDSRDEALIAEFGKTYFATISTKGDSDFYKLSVPDSGKVAVYLEDVPSNIRPYIKLYRETRKSWIYSAAAFAGEDLVMEFEVDKPSNYFIQVQDRYNSERSFLRYRLSAVYVPDDEPIPEGALYFHRDIGISDIKHKKEISVDIPGIKKKGKYYLQAALESSSPQKNGQAVERFYVTDTGTPLEPARSPDIKISYLEDESLAFKAGEKSRFRFKAVNQGNAIGKCEIDFKFKDLFDYGINEFLEPDTEKDLVFEFLIPDDMEEGTYQAEYTFEDRKYIVNFRINGIKVEVNAMYKDNIFKIKIENKSLLENLNLFVEARCGGFEERKTFVLNEKEELIFDIKETEGEDKIYYGIYFVSGKAIYLNSFLLEDVDEPDIFFKIMEVDSDKDDYEAGDKVQLKWKIDSQDQISIRLMAELIGPDSIAVKVIDEDIDLDEGPSILSKKISPEFTKAGLYRVIYRFIYAESVIAQGSIFFDAGEEARIQLHMNKREYIEGENIKLIACIFSSFALEGNLTLLLDEEVVKARNINLDGYKEFIFNIKTSEIGKHAIYASLFYDDQRFDSTKESCEVLPKPKPNRSPILFTIGQKEVMAGDSLEFFVEAEDLDGDELSYFTDALPEGAIFNSEARRFLWKPGHKQFGEYFVTFSVTDGKDIAFEKVMINVKKAIPLPPKVNALAEPVKGMAPLEVYFSANSIDDDGEIVKYEWDFDGKGVYDFNSLESGNTVFIYTGEGSFPVSLRVTDNKGYTNTHSVAIDVARNPDAPLAYLEAMLLKGVAPCKIYFQGAAFSTADICKYEWDFDGDGVYDSYSATSSEVVNTYSESGIFDAELKVTNSEGLSDSKSVTIEILDPLVLDIEPVLSCDTGDVPLEVDFDAVIKADNGIQKYQWDFEGDGIFDFTSTQSAITEHVYYDPGLYMPTLRVVDRNNISKENKKEIRCGVKNIDRIKTGKVIIETRKGKAPFRAGFSLDTDLDIADVNYFWDFDGDGACDLVSNSQNVEFIYTDSGVYVAEVRIRYLERFIGSFKETIYVINGKKNYKATKSDSGLGLKKRKDVYKDKSDKIELLDKTGLLLPAGILGEDDVVDIRKIEEDEIHKKIEFENNIIHAGEYREYKFDNHNGVFDKELLISIPYLDEDEDGFVDGKNIDELTLNIYWYDENIEEWKILSDCLVFPKENLVTAKTSHFTIFGIAGLESKISGTSKADGGDNGGVDCFIATAAFGTPLADEVRVFCEFRDRYLTESKMGSRFTDLYYSFSPPIANFIRNSPFLKALVRFHLKLLVKLLKLVL